MVIYRHKDKYSISAMCRFFNVSRSGYYGYVSRMNVPAWDLPLADKIREAKKREKVTAELQLHSDQGFQYTSHGYYRLIQSYGITPSMSRKGNPYDNALAENFFSILKTECIYRTKLQTYEDARLLIDEYIHFYNHQRIQLKTKLTPFEKRSQYVA